MTYRLRAGTHTVAELTSAYDVRGFPKQSDQEGLMWFSPDESIAREFASVTTSMDGLRGGFGNREVEWIWGALTALQVKYLRDTFFGSALYATVTIRTWDRAYGWRVFNCTALWNEPSESAEAPVGLSGYMGLRISFINCVEAPEGS